MIGKFIVFYNCIEENVNNYNKRGGGRGLVKLVS